MFQLLKVDIVSRIMLLDFCRGYMLSCISGTVGGSRSLFLFEKEMLLNNCVLSR